jgi:hypothetical protein
MRPTRQTRYATAHDLDSWKTDQRIAAQGFAHRWDSVIADGNGEDFSSSCSTSTSTRGWMLWMWAAATASWLCRLPGGAGRSVRYQAAIEQGQTLPAATH